MNPENIENNNRTNVTGFSPEGRLRQVENAQKAVKRGSISLGVRSDEGVVLLSKSDTASSLAVSEGTRTLDKVCSYIGATSSGNRADGRQVVDQMRELTQESKLAYGTEPLVRTVSKQTAAKMQEPTHTTRTRPFGTSLLIGGVDETGPHLFQIGSNGSLDEWKAAATGGDHQERYQQYLESAYDDTISLKEAVRLALSAVGTVEESSLVASDLELATIATPSGEFQFIDDRIITEQLAELDFLDD